MARESSLRRLSETFMAEEQQKNVAAEAEAAEVTNTAADENTGGDGNVASVLEDVVEEAVKGEEIPSAAEAGVTDEDEEPITSLDTAADLPDASRGYTGEIRGRVVTLAELGEADEEEVQRRASYDQLMKLVDETFTTVTENEIVKGRVVSIGDKDAVIDIGFKSDGIVSLSEWEQELQPGDEVEVFLERLEDYHGQLVLSKTKADQVRRWLRIEEAFENEEVLEGTIIRRIKGGMIVELFGDMEAFLPGSQIDVRPVRDFDAYLERRMEFKIVKLNPANENIVVSHKALIEKDLQAQREKILGTMEVGQVLEGTVKNIVDFGVFIDLGGVDGLLHITDLSWGRVSHPSELVELDEKLNVVVLDYDKERQRISLGLKQLQPHPWDDLGERYSEGDVVEGKVVSITDYGAFVELEKGIEGLVHISEMSWTEHIRHPSQTVSLGQLVNVKILNIDNEGKKISLGMKQLEPDPWTGISDRYPPGTVMRGKVRNITNFGVFVEIEPGIDGLVHISDLSWTKKVRHPAEVVKKGQDLDVVILNIDEESRRISLGHKQVQTNPWTQLEQVYSVGADTNAKVVSIGDEGLVVELPMDAEGVVPVSELKSGAAHFDQQYRVGEELELRVIKFDPSNKEIVLSETAKQRAAESEARSAEISERRETRQRERRAVDEYTRTAASGPTTLGELSGLAALKAQIEQAEQETADAGAQDASADAGAQEASADAEAQEASAEAPADESSAEADETLVVPAEGSGKLEGTTGIANRTGGDAKSDDAGGDEDPAETAQRKEDAGEVTPSEMSKAAHKGAGDIDKEGIAAAAEADTQDATPSRGSGTQPVSATEGGQTTDEIESFTKPEGEERVVNKDDVAKPDKDA